MQDLFAAFTTLNCVYLFLLLAGVIWTALVLIGGAVSDVDLPNVDLDMPTIDLPGDIDIPHINFHLDHDLSFDHGSVEISPLSPITIASFGASFGGLGLIATQLLQMSDPVSLIFATVGATCIAAGMFFFYSRVLVGGDGSSQVRLADISGKKAEVIIPIPPAGVGQVAFVARGTRSTWSARASDGETVPRGAIVTIRSVTGNTVIIDRQS